MRRNKSGPSVVEMQAIWEIAHQNHLAEKKQTRIHCYGAMAAQLLRINGIKPDDFYPKMTEIMSLVILLDGSIEKILGVE